MRVRWWVCLLLFLTWLVSYIDRSLMPMALPFIGEDFHLSPAVMGALISAFFVGYASMQIPGGMIADKLGPRRTITLGIALWSVFSILTGAATNLTNMIWVRTFFGLGEGLHPAAAFKAVAMWFNSGERARANAFVMSSNTLGPTIAPILFGAVMGAFGWRNAFYIVSLPGVLIAFIVYLYLRDKPSEHPKMTARELAEIGTQDCSQNQVRLSELLTYPVLWQLFFIYLTWDVTWWGFQAWLPSYLLKARGFTLVNTSFVAALPFAAGFLGVLIAGYVSDRTRKPKAVLIFVLLGNALFMLLTATAGNTTTAVICLTATGFFLPAVHGPFWSLPMDLLPSNVMGYSTGFLNTGGQIAGVGSPIVMGALIQLTGHYDSGFVFLAISAGVSAVLAAALRAKSPAARQSTVPITSSIPPQREPAQIFRGDRTGLR